MDGKPVKWEIKDGNIAELLIDFGINGTSENDKDITLKITKTQIL